MAISRRCLLQTGACSALIAAAPVRLSLAGGVGDNRFVFVVLRGGMDGLAALVPHGDRDHARVRSSLAIPGPGTREGAAELDGFFGLHPALGPIYPWYRDGHLLPVHAVATPYRDRSHFDAQDLLENGTGRPRGRPDGWLNRALGLMEGGGRRLGLALGQVVPLVLRGGTEVVSWAPSALSGADPEFLNLVDKLYAGDRELARVYQAALDAAGMAEAAGGAGMAGMGRAGGRGPRAAVRAYAEAAGRLLAEPGGPRVAVLELPGWDTHAGQGTANGRLANALQVLADAMAMLRQSLGAAVWDRTIVLAATEFGRTVAPNGTGGTDHGTGGAAFLAGGSVAGGRVLADWPGLSRLHEGRDLTPTLDLRAVTKAVLRDHLGLDRSDLDTAVFPDSTGVRPADRLVRT